MKKLLLMLIIAVVTFLLVDTSYGQNTDEIELLSQIDKKPIASYEDAVTLFVFQLGKSPSTFEKDTAILETEGIALKEYNKEAPLTKGMLSKMTAEYLKLGGSLMYYFFHTERYAFKACIANSIFSESGSKSDILNGPAMIEVFSRMNEIKGEQK